LEIISDQTKFHIEEPTAAAIGKFDGIHIGHRKLLEEILSCKKRGLAACVFTFDPPPAVLFGFSDGRVLYTKEEKRLIFGRMGVDILIEFPMNRESAATPPERFVEEILVGQMKTRFLVAGTDLSFGAGGAGDMTLLHRMGGELGFETMFIPKVQLEGQEVSSTLVREQVEGGQMEKAARLLGMPYLIAGKVENGRHLGRKLGFPTLNVRPKESKLLPPAGVYFSQVRCREKLYRAISNVGCKPTVTDEKVMIVESYLYDFHESVYGEPVEVCLHSFHRPERRFESLEALQSQLKRDIAAGALRP